MTTLDNQLQASAEDLQQRSSSASVARFYPWLVIALSACFLFYKYVLQISPSVMTDDLMRHFHVGGAGLGNLAATFFYSYLVVQLFVGPLLDKYSPRILMSLAIALCAVGALFFAQAQTLLNAELSRALIGAGAAFGTVGYMKMAAVWFKPRQFAFVGGLLATAAMTGSMASQAPLALLVSDVGWRSSLYYCGLAGLVLAVLFFVFVKSKNPANQATQAVEKLRLSHFMSILKKKHNWYLMLYSGLAFSPLAVFGGLWGDPFLQEAHHLTKTSAAAVVSLMFLGLAVGGPALGILSDRLGKRFEVMVFGLLLSFVSLVLAIYAPMPVWAVGLCLLLFGFGTGAFMLGFTMGKEANPVILAATVIGLINTGDALFGAFSEPLVGKVLDVLRHGATHHGVAYFSVANFDWALVMLPVYLLLAGVFLWSIREKSA